MVGDACPDRLHGFPRVQVYNLNPTFYMVDFTMNCIERYWRNKCMGSDCKSVPTRGGVDPKKTPLPFNPPYSTKKPKNTGAVNGMNAD